MQVISEINNDLLKILNEFSDFFYNRDNSHLDKIIGSNPKMKSVSIKEKKDEALSEEYLKEALKTPEKYGFPRHSWGLELVYDRIYIDDKDLINNCNNTNNKLMNFFGARNNALQMYYPPGGYIGWHNNGNAHGYNIILTCNPGAKGYFDHYDHVNDKHNVYHDKPGWNCKVGYFGPFKEPENVCWHSAGTESPRLTFSYVIFDKNIWEDMVEDIKNAR